MSNLEAAVPKVTAVIPTLGGASLTSAIRSALAQTYTNLDIIISVDGAGEISLSQEHRDDPRITVIYGDARRGPKAAREAAVRLSDADFIAFLDDDDRWRPHKIERQVAAAVDALAAGAGVVVIAVRVALVNAHGHHIQTVPRRLLQPGQRISDYLFTRHEVRPGESALGASMLLISRSALEVPRGGDDSYLHEDWAMLIDLAERADVTFIMIDEVLLEYTVQPTGSSASSRAAWETSLAWFDARTSLSPREYADGVLCVTGILAANQRDARGVLRVARRALASGAGGRQAWVFFLGSVLLPSRVRASLTRAVEKLVTRATGRRTRMNVR